MARPPSGCTSLPSLTCLKIATNKLDSFPGMYTAESAEKEFLYQRKVLSELEHPFIIKGFVDVLPSVGFVLPMELGVCSVKDMLRVGACFCPITMHGLITASTLRQAVDRTQPPNANTLPPKVVKYLAAQIFLAMVYMHAKGILWGDAKPANMVLMEDFTLRLIDVGESTSNPRRKHNDSDFVAACITNMSVSHTCTRRLKGTNWLTIYDCLDLRISRRFQIRHAPTSPKNTTAHYC